MNELKIKRCPFCDGVAELDFAHGSFTYTDKNGEARYTGFYYTVKCTNEICGCCIGIYEEPEMAIKAWNRRVSEMSGTEGRVNKMDDYISRKTVTVGLDYIINGLNKLITDDSPNDVYTDIKNQVEEIKRGVLNIPPEDVQPVVYCSKCANNYSTPHNPMCDFMDAQLYPDSFCSKGNRKGEDNG